MHYKMQAIELNFVSHEQILNKAKVVIKFVIAGLIVNRVDFTLKYKGLNFFFQLRILQPCSHIKIPFLTFNFLLKGL